MDLEQFLEERRSGIGGSDAAALFNEGRSCRRRMVLEKQGKEPDYPDSREMKWLERGVMLESIAAEIFAKRTKTELREIGIRRLPDYPYLMVHLDRIIVDPSRDELGLLELKTMMREQYYDLKKNGMRTEHILQVQWGYMVTGLAWGAYGSLWPDGWDMIHFPVEPDKKLMDALFTEGYLAWKEVQGELALPDRLNPNDKRCQVCPFRRSCQGDALLKLLDQADASVDNSLPLTQAVEQFVDAKEILENAEALVREARVDLEAQLGDRTVVDTPGHRIYFKPQTRRGLDTKRLKKDHPDVTEGYEKETVSRPLRVYSK